MSKIESNITSALKKTLSALKALKEADAKSVADKTGREYGRESSYLNTLARMGLVEKRRAGHQTLFAVKSVPLTILKLGGSVITDRVSEYTVRSDVISRLSEEIGRALKSEKGPRRLIVVIGGGSFGHPTAVKYGFHRDPRVIDDLQILGVAETQHMLIRLASIVVDDLLHKEVPAVLVEAQGGVYQPDGKIDTSLFSLWLNSGLVPVISGAVLIDNQKNAHVVSADELVHILANRLKPTRVIFGIDLDGLYTEDPKISRTAKVIEELSSEILDTIGFGPTKYVDITGGMLGKIQYAFNVARLGIEVKIVNGTKPHVIEKALCGEKVLGTRLKA